MGGFIGGGAMGWRLAAASMLAVLAGAATYWGAASGFPA
jgi:hypothetical protein